MSPEDQAELARLVNEEGGDDPLIIANEEAMNMMKELMSDCKCPSCVYLRACFSRSLSLDNETNPNLN